MGSMSEQENASPNYCLDNFEGPLAFLLHLVQKSEISISEVSVHSIIEQYINRLTSKDLQNLDTGAEFVSTTASLMWLKSKMLLPMDKSDLDELEDLEEDSPFTIIPKLLEYCRFKEVSHKLREREQHQQTLYSRGEDPTFTPSKTLLGIEKVSLEKLSSLFEDVLRRCSSQKGMIKEEIWRITDKIRILRERVKTADKIPFEEVFSSQCCREELIVTFLAVLELMKLQELCVVQEEERTFITGVENE